MEDFHLVGIPVDVTKSEHIVACRSMICFYAGMRNQKSSIDNLYSNIYAGEKWKAPYIEEF